MTKEWEQGNLDKPLGYLMRLDRGRFGIAVEPAAYEAKAFDGIVVVVAGPFGSLSWLWAMALE